MKEARKAFYNDCHKKTLKSYFMPYKNKSVRYVLLFSSISNLHMQFYNYVPIILKYNIRTEIHLTHCNIPEKLWSCHLPLLTINKKLSM